MGTATEHASTAPFAGRKLSTTIVQSQLRRCSGPEPNESSVVVTSSKWSFPACRHRSAVEDDPPRRETRLFTAVDSPLLFTPVRLPWTWPTATKGATMTCMGLITYVGLCYQNLCQPPTNSEASSPPTNSVTWVKPFELIFVPQ